VILYIDWVISIAALCWLITVAVVDIRVRKTLNPYWTWIPMLLAGTYRVFIGPSALIAASVAVVIGISERNHLRSKGLEVMSLAAGIIAIVLIFFVADIPTQSGIVGVVVFWIAWELHYISGIDAMTLITCVLLWQRIEFVMAYLVAGLIWSIGIRVKEGGWLKSHLIPMPAVIAFSALIYLVYKLLFLAVI
jgi:hypothetical protein